MIALATREDLSMDHGGLTQSFIPTIPFPRDVPEIPGIVAQLLRIRAPVTTQRLDDFLRGRDFLGGSAEGVDR